MRTGANRTSARVSRPETRTAASVEWKFVSKTWTPPPMRTSSPILMDSSQTIVVLDIPTRLPIKSTPSGPTRMRLPTEPISVFPQPVRIVNRSPTVATPPRDTLTDGTPMALSPRPNRLPLSRNSIRTWRVPLHVRIHRERAFTTLKGFRNIDHGNTTAGSGRRGGRAENPCWNEDALMVAGMRRILAHSETPGNHARASLSRFRTGRTPRRWPCPCHSSGTRQADRRGEG